MYKGVEQEISHMCVKAKTLEGMMGIYFSEGLSYKVKKVMKDRNF